MSGRVIVSAPRPHKCAPGWRNSQGSDGRTFGIPPAAWDFPKGTVWQCECGQTWVSKGAISPHSPGFTHWKREGRWARRRRERGRS